MYISRPILGILVVLILVAALAEGVLVARVTKGFVVHEYHGILNGKVGQPYERFIQELLSRHEGGDADGLGRALRVANDKSRELYDVWLLDSRPNAYRDSVDAILK